MAAMTTALTVFSTFGDTRTFVQSGHSVSAPKLVIQKRKVPKGNQKVGETVISVVNSTVDSASLPLESRVQFSASIRYPVDGSASDVAAALATFRDIVAGDEFAAAVNGQYFLV
jgi:hypothetical protein